jgi:hypothetical protein
MGFGTPDDAEAWERVQNGSVAGEQEWILVNRGLRRQGPTADGTVAGGVSSEIGMRAAYRQYKKAMSA